MDPLLTVLLALLLTTRIPTRLQGLPLQKTGQPGGFTRGKLSLPDVPSSPKCLGINDLSCLYREDKYDSYQHKKTSDSQEFMNFFRSIKKQRKSRKSSSKLRHGLDSNELNSVVKRFKSSSFKNPKFRRKPNFPPRRLWPVTYRRKSKSDLAWSKYNSIGSEKSFPVVRRNYDNRVLEKYALGKRKSERRHRQKLNLFYSRSQEIEDIKYRRSDIHTRLFKEKLLRNYKQFQKAIQKDADRGGFKRFSSQHQAIKPVRKLPAVSSSARRLNARNVPYKRHKVEAVGMRTTEAIGRTTLAATTFRRKRATDTKFSTFAIHRVSRATQKSGTLTTQTSPSTTTNSYSDSARKIPSVHKNKLTPETTPQTVIASHEHFTNHRRTFKNGEQNTAVGSASGDKTDLSGRRTDTVFETTTAKVSTSLERPPQIDSIGAPTSTLEYTPDQVLNLKGIYVLFADKAPPIKQKKPLLRLKTGNPESVSSTSDLNKELVNKGIVQGGNKQQAGKVHHAATESERNKARSKLKKYVGTAVIKNGQLFLIVYPPRKLGDGSPTHVTNGKQHTHHHNIDKTGTNSATSQTHNYVESNAGSFPDVSSHTPKPRPTMLTQTTTPLQTTSSIHPSTPVHTTTSKHRLTSAKAKTSTGRPSSTQTTTVIQSTTSKQLSTSFKTTTPTPTTMSTQLPTSAKTTRTPKTTPSERKTTSSGGWEWVTPTFTTPEKPAFSHSTNGSNETTAPNRSSNRITTTPNTFRDVLRTGTETNRWIHNGKGKSENITIEILSSTTTATTTTTGSPSSTSTDTDNSKEIMETPPGDTTTTTETPLSTVQGTLPDKSQFKTSSPLPSSIPVKNGDHRHQTEPLKKHHEMTGVSNAPFSDTKANKGSVTHTNLVDVSGTKTMDHHTHPPSNAPHSHQSTTMDKHSLPDNGVGTHDSSSDDNDSSNDNAPVARSASPWSKVDLTVVVPAPKSKPNPEFSKKSVAFKLLPVMAEASDPFHSIKTVMALLSQELPASNQTKPENLTIKDVKTGAYFDFELQMNKISDMFAPKTEQPVGVKKASSLTCRGSDCNQWQPEHAYQELSTPPGPNHVTKDVPMKPLESHQAQESLIHGQHSSVPAQKGQEVTTSVHTSIHSTSKSSLSAPSSVSTTLTTRAVSKTSPTTTDTPTTVESQPVSSNFPVLSTLGTSTLSTTSATFLLPELMREHSTTESHTTRGGGGIVSTPKPEFMTTETTSSVLRLKSSTDSQTIPPVSVLCDLSKRNGKTSEGGINESLCVSSVLPLSEQLKPRNKSDANLASKEFSSSTQGTNTVPERHDITHNSNVIRFNKKTTVPMGQPPTSLPVPKRNMFLEDLIVRQSPIPQPSRILPGTKHNGHSRHNSHSIIKPPFILGNAYPSNFTTFVGSVPSMDTSRRSHTSNRHVQTGANPMEEALSMMLVLSLEDLLSDSIGLHGALIISSSGFLESKVFKERSTR